MRRNLKNNFEEMYLRYNMVKKHIKEADPTIVDDPNFKRCVAFMTKRYFFRYKDFFVSNGFEMEDVSNIVMLFGLTYWGHSKPASRDHNAFNIMMRYINQRMQTTVRWISKKFHTEEISAIVSLDSLHGDIRQDDNDLFDLDSLSSDNIIESSPRRKTNVKNIDDELLAEDQRRAKKEIRASKKRDKQLSFLLKKKLEHNPSLYSEDLCYYATSKHVGKDVRMKARSMCREYGIDYVQWLKDKSHKIDFNLNQFTF
jgi:hypothetical protein